MADLYTNLANTCVKLINKYGRDITLRTNVQSGTSYAPTLTPSDETVKGVSTNFMRSEIDGTLIKMGDNVFLVYYASDITVENQIIDGTTVYAIMSIDIIKPGDTLILYKLQTRKSATTA